MFATAETPNPECIGHASNPTGSVSAVVNQIPQRVISARNQNGRRTKES